MKIYRIAQEIHTAAVVVLNKENKALILLRGDTAPWRPNTWNLPGGGIDEKDTSPLAAAVRECQEEAGISPNNLSQLGSTNGVMFFKGYTQTNNVSINFESKTYAWIGPEDLENYEFAAPSIPNAIKTVFDQIEQEKPKMFQEEQDAWLKRYRR